MLHDNDEARPYRPRTVKIDHEDVLRDAQPEKSEEGVKMTAEQQAEAHWKYVEGVLAVHMVNKSEIALVGHHYRTAFVHGWKHAEEAANVKG